MKTRLIILFLFAISGLLSAGFAYGTSVQNDVSVKASTGGNSSGGTTNNGSGEASVFIETKVDGEVVHHIEETKQSEAGEPIEIEKRLEYIAENVSIQTQANTQIHSETGEIHSELQTHEQQVEEDQPAESQGENQAGQEDTDNTESKSLISSIVEFFRNLFSGFFA